jgi:hypothetical protein
MTFYGEPAIDAQKFIAPPKPHFFEKKIDLAVSFWRKKIPKKINFQKSCIDFKHFSGQKSMQLF